MNSSSPIDSHSYTQECTFEQAMNGNIADLWQRREEGFIKSFDKTKLYWCRLTCDSHNKAIVVVNGRIEAAWKYQELFYDLFQQGYDIYSFDHRGQGLSDRMLGDPQMGHVNDFEDYILDMERLLTHFDLTHYEQRFLLAHSMGGAIATRYLQTHPQHSFDAIAVSAPMYGVSVPWYLSPIAVPLSMAMTTIYAQPTYAPGHQAYYPKPFEINPLTQSEVRYRWFRDLYDRMPQLQIGGPSTRWVWQGLLAAKQCILLTRQLTLPFLLLQAERDTIVSNKAQDVFIRKLRKTNPDCELQVIQGSRHELLFEIDRCRNQALDSLLAFFDRHGSTRAK
ncbi:alpha/beta fold hydrolase [Vibrio proteolyticus]